MIGHGKFKRRLLDYIEGELPSGKREGIEKHLQWCADCRVEMEALKKVRERLKSAPDALPDAAVWAAFPARVRAAVAREKARRNEIALHGRTKRWKSLFWISSAALAGIALMTIGFFLTRGIGTQPAEPDWASVNPERLVLELAGTDPILLQDVFADEAVEGNEWMTDLAGMTDQEIEGMLSAGFSTDEAIGLRPELYREFYEEEQT